jgi:uncharacterized membrane protein YcaP (DUF421 family)
VDGQVDWKQMQQSHITEHDLKEALRLEASTEKIEDVAVATLERSGEISVVEKPKTPQVVEVAVQNGVQTVRVEIG